MIIPSKDSDKEDEGKEEHQVPKAKSMQKVVWSIKEMKRRSKRQPTSKSCLEPDTSDDEFNEPDSTEEDSGDDMSAVGGGRCTL
jgi:hypothetical protein